MNETNPPSGGDGPQADDVRRPPPVGEEETSGGRAFPRDSAKAIADSTGADLATVAAAVLQMLDEVGALMAVKDVISGRHLHVNRAMAELFGRTAAEMVGATDLDLMMEPAQAVANRAAEQAALVQSIPTQGVLRIEREGHKREFSVSRIALPRADGAASHHVGSVWLEFTSTHQRETQLQQALTQIEQQQVASEALIRETQDQGLRDAVTGLYQRPHFDDQLRREVDLSSREHREFALVSIALDPSPENVRLMGAPAALRIFEALGRLLRSNTRAMDASCRLDEHRFAVLLSGVGLATAHSRMEGLRRQCATQIVVLDGREISFSVSMGVASFPHTAHTEAELMSAADHALAEAEKRGGNHVTLASIRFESS